MKIGFNPESIVDLDGMPLVGRVTLYVHDSDDILDVFTLEGDTFVPAANPQLLNDAGRLDATLFFDAAIVDVKLERYIGAEGMMSVDSPDEDFEQFDHFEIGFDPGTFAVKSSVDTIADLMNTSPDSGFVEVLGYYAVGDCVPRTYYWDADSQNDIDGGYVVGSNVSDSGRWILLWGDEMMPSSVYGVVPGSNEANINALLTYPNLVGSFLQKTAPVVRFLRGNYTSSVSYSTTKEIAFDSGAKFTGASFSLSRARVLGPVIDYIADFIFADKTSEAHSSWFRTALGFWRCGAKTLFVDNSNNFSDTTISSAVKLDDTNIFGKGRIASTYTNDSYLWFNGCNIAAEKFLSPQLDYVKLTNMRWKDSWWTGSGYTAFDFGKISDGNRIEFLTSGVNVIQLSDFGNADVYVKARVADVKNSLSPDRSLFLENRKLSTLNVDCFTEIHDCIVTGSCVVSDNDNDGNQVHLFNVISTDFECDTDHLIMSGCQIAFSVGLGSSSSVDYIDATDSIVSAISGSTYKLNCSPRINAYGCEWSLSVLPTTNDTDTTESAAFKDCYIHNSELSYKSSYFDSCRIENCNIEIYPYQESSVYKIQLEMLNCSIKGGTPVTLKKYEDVTLDNVKDIVPNIRIVGNRFIGINGNTKGITMPFYSNVTNQSLFIRSGSLLGGYSSDGAIVLYKDNVGDCPQDSATSRFYSAFSSVSVIDATLMQEIGASTYSNSQVLRACPDFSSKSEKSGWEFAVKTMYYSNLQSGSNIPSAEWGYHIVNACQLVENGQSGDNDFFSLKIALVSDPGSNVPGYM